MPARRAIFWIADRMPDTLAHRRKRLRFRSWHRGMRDADLLLGGFADAYLESLSERQLDRYEALLEISDADLYDWIVGKAPVPADHDHDVMIMIRSHTLRR